MGSGGTPRPIVSSRFLGEELLGVGEESQIFIRIEHSS